MLRQHTELMDRILTSEKARQIVNYHVAQIYGNSEIGLRLFQAIGEQLDDMNAWVEEFVLQVVPQTATWGLDYWEAEYGLAYDPDMSIEKRRERVISKRRDRSQINPHRLAQIASVASANAEVEIEENTGKNKFTVLISAIPNETTMQAVKEAIRRAKPAHLIFDTQYMQYGITQQHYGGIMQMSYDITMEQVG